MFKNIIPSNDVTSCLGKFYKCCSQGLRVNERYIKYPIIRNTIQETAGTRFAKKGSFYKKQNLDLNLSCLRFHMEGGQVLSEG